MKNDADVNAKNNSGLTALMYAIQFSNDTSSLETVQLLLIQPNIEIDDHSMNWLIKNQGKQKAFEMVFKSYKSKNKIELLEKVPNKLKLLKHNIKWCHLNWNLIKKYIPKKTCICCFKYTQTPVMKCKYDHPFHLKCLVIHNKCVVCKYI